MKPITFNEVNCVYAKDQPQYNPLPTHRDSEGVVTSCWGLTWKERLLVLFSGKIWISLMTFNRPLQPQLPSVERPIFEAPPVLDETE